MKQIIVEKFGGIEELKLVELPNPQPGPGEVLIRMTSIGMNHAELMARRGEYRLSSGEPPFTPGLEGGGLVEAVGDGIMPEMVGERVTLTADAPRPNAGGPGGTYRTHYVVSADKVLVLPDNLPEDELGTLWLAYLTAWGCLKWKQQLQPGQFVAIPAASSSVGLAASQIVKELGGVAIGMTTSEEKAEMLRHLPEARFDHVVVTHLPDRTMRRWQRDLQKITGGKGVDVFFDPVASGDYLNMEIRSLAKYGTIWVYGLLGNIGPVDVSPLIRLHGSIRGWVLGELYTDGGPAVEDGYREILRGVRDGKYRMYIGGRFPLEEVQQAHAEMEKGKHVGKLVLIP